MYFVPHICQHRVSIVLFCFQSGDTPLLRAVRSRNAEMVQLLLEKKTRVNVVDNRGDTVLHIAMRARSKVKHRCLPLSHLSVVGTVLISNYELRL